MRLAHASCGCHADTCERHVSDCHETVTRHKSCDSHETRTLHAICARFSCGFCARVAHAYDGRHADAHGVHATRLSRDSQETKIFARDFSRDFCKGFIQRAPSFLKDRGGDEQRSRQKTVRYPLPPLIRRTASGVAWIYLHTLPFAQPPLCLW